MSSFRGNARRFGGAGLGIHVRPEVLERHTVERRTFAAEHERSAA